ncbi:MAG: 4-hydroxy-tetrahydrodipicolinate synthase [Clostridia bacterium]|nr:4-hydroxy-tetrahydrodipicolinate synthase [Clostridia bacterium]
MTEFLRGTATALITPFTERGVNFDALEKLIRYQIENGTDALVVLGTTGEPATMTEDEKESVISFAVKQAKGKCKIIVGTGSNCTEKAVLASQKAEAIGADGVLAVTPYYNKCTQKGLVAYYKAIASAVKIPVIAYNVPSRTGVNILPETMKEIAEIPNIAGIKEASGNMAQVMETARLIRGKCDLYSGEDILNFPILAAGGVAVISVVSNLLPKEIKTLTQLIFKGDYKNALILSEKLLPVAKACFTEVNPIPVKAGANLMGFHAGAPRAPLSECEAENVEKLKKALIDFGVKL